MEKKVHCAESHSKSKRVNSVEIERSREWSERGCGANACWRRLNKKRVGNQPWGFGALPMQCMLLYIFVFFFFCGIIIFIYFLFW